MRVSFVVLIAGLACVPPAHPQPVAPPGVIRAPNGPLQRSLDEQRTAFVERQRCISENAAAFRLYVATQDLVEIRDNPGVAEMELARNPSARTQFPGGHREMVATAFKRYRDAGGEAQSADNVTRIADPCPLAKLFKK